jgi:hypothetical protein
MAWTDELKAEIRKSREKANERQDKADEIILVVQQILEEAVALSNDALVVMGVRPDANESSRGWHVAWQAEGMPRSVTICVYPESGELFIHKLHENPVYLDVLEPGPKLINAITSTLIYLAKGENWERFSAADEFLGHEVSGTTP